MGVKYDEILDEERSTDFAGDPNKVVTLEEGLHANRPVSPVTALMWYSTDIQQLFQWTSDGWINIG